jgi:hypothetical protein
MSGAPGSGREEHKIMMSALWVMVLAASVLPEAPAEQVEAGAQTLWAGRLTGKHSAREVRWDGEVLEVGAPDEAALWSLSGITRVGAASACRVEGGWIGVAAQGAAGWEAIRLVEQGGRWLESRWPLPAAPVSGWSQQTRRGGCWMGIVLADGTMALVGPGAEQAELERGAVAPSAAPEELVRGLLNTSVGGWAVYGGPDGAMHARALDGAVRARFELGAVAMPEVVLDQAGGRLWWMTRDGALWSWAPGVDEPARVVAGQGAVSAGPVAWPGVGLVWGDLGGRVWRWDGVGVELLVEHGAGLPWAPLVFDAFDEAGRAALWVTDDGGGLLLRSEGGMVEGVRLALGVRSAVAPRVVPVDVTDARPWLALGQGDGVSQRVRFERPLSGRLEGAETRLGVEPTLMVEAVQVSRPETPETDGPSGSLPEPPAPRPAQGPGAVAVSAASCAVGGAAGGAGGVGAWWLVAGMGLVVGRRHRRRGSRRA